MGTFYLRKGFALFESRVKRGARARDLSSVVEFRTVKCNLGSLPSGVVKLGSQIAFLIGKGY